MIKRKADMRNEIRNKMRGGNGDVSLIHYLEQEETAGKSRFCAQLSIPVGASIGTHSHGPDAEIFIILNGTALFDDNGTTYTLNPGDIAFTSNGENHSISNAGDTMLDLVGVIFE